MGVKEQIDLSRLPEHIAIIMDGNGRWAKERRKSRLFGHHEGVQSVRAVAEACAEIGIRYLTLYAFSTENWNRPAEEVQGIMELLVTTIRKEVSTLQKNNIRLHTIGDTQRLPENCKRELKEAQEITSENTGLNLIMALSYSARWEIINAAKHFGMAVKQGKIDPQKMDKDLFEKYLCTADIPDPEMMIRTGGDCRMSNFLLYQMAYAELFFTETKWPDFRKDNLYNIILEFQSRERRFGKTSEQIQ